MSGSRICARFPGTPTNGSSWLSRRYDGLARHPARNRCGLSLDGVGRRRRRMASRIARMARVLHPGRHLRRRDVVERAGHVREARPSRGFPVVEIYVPSRSGSSAVDWDCSTSSAGDWRAAGRARRPGSMVPAGSAERRRRGGSVQASIRRVLAERGVGGGWRFPARRTWSFCAEASLVRRQGSIPSTAKTIGDYLLCLKAGYNG